MKAIVLAAGIGKRLQPLTNHLPKCLLEVDRKPLVDYYFAAFSNCGIDEAVYVIGHEAEMIKKKLGKQYLGVKVHYIQNPIYETSGSAYSLWLAKNEFTREPFIISDSDMLFPPELLRVVIEAKHDNAMMIENDPTKFSEDPVWVLAEKGVVTKATKNLVTNSECIGECVGLFKFGGEAPRALKDGLRNYLDFHGLTSQYDDAYNDVYPHLQVHPIWTEGLPWAEIDTQKALEKARRDTYPRIAALASASEHQSERSGVVK
jgi:choline kinase